MEDVTQAPDDKNLATEETGVPPAIALHDTQEADAPPPPIYVRPSRNRPKPADTPQPEHESPSAQPVAEVEKAQAPATVDTATVTATAKQEVAQQPRTKPAPRREQSAVPTPALSIAGGLPPTPPAAYLPQVRTRKSWIALCFTITFLIYVAFVPVFLRYSSPPTGDQPFYLMDTISIIQDGDLNVRNNYNQHPDGSYDFDKFYKLAPHPEDFVGMGAPYPLPPQYGPTTARPPSEWYGAHPPGLAITLIPAWIIGSWFSLWWPATIVFMCLVGALVAVNAFLLAHEMTGKLWIAFAVWLPIAFSVPVMTYSYMLFTELSTGLLLIYAFRRLAMGWGANGPIRLTLVALCIGYIPWLAWRAAPVAILMSLFALVQWWRYWRATRPGARQALLTQAAVAPNSYQVAEEKPTKIYPRKVSPWFKETGVIDHETRRQSRSAESTPQPSQAESQQMVSSYPVTTLRPLASAVWVLLLLSISAGLLAIYNTSLYGSLAPTSIADPNYYFQWPWAGQDNLIKFTNAAFGLLFDQEFGLLPYAPFYLLAAVGAIVMFRSERRTDRALLLWLAIITLPYMGLVAGFSGWSGIWCPPARYLTTFVPLLAAPLGMSLYAASRTRIRGLLYGAIYVALTIPGLFFMSIMLRDARNMWLTQGQDGPVFAWLAKAPESPLKINLVPLIPNHIWPDETRQPQLTAWAIGLSLGIIFLGYLLTFRPQSKIRIPHSAFRNRRWPLVAHGIVWLGAGAFLVYGWMTANYKHLEHKTLLTQQRAWSIGPVPVAGRGMAYLNNKLYITDYIAPSVGVLDLATGNYNLLQPILPDGSLIPFFHPGDVKVGPDGLLYVLNNGPGNQAMLVMQSDGHVVRQTALNGKTPISIGLDFAQDGSAAYVTDMTGSKVLKYNPSFGDFVEWYGGATGGFNNVWGIAVDKDGTLYVSESSPPMRIQQLNPGDAGKFVREFKLECSPQYIAINGDWLDLSCSTRIISVNKVSGKMQSSRYEGANVIRPENPMGVTYGPDGTLYVLDGGRVIQYTVQH